MPPLYVAVAVFSTSPQVAGVVTLSMRTETLVLPASDVGR